MTILLRGLSRQFPFARVDSKLEMSLFFSNKAVRLLLSVSVSIWMAGGCLFGCATGVMGAESAPESVVENAASCHVTQPHKKQIKTTLNLLQGVPSFIPGPRDMMRDCPLGVNGTAVTSKSSAQMPEPARGPVAALPSFEKQSVQTELTRVDPFLHNRGSTHLQCCVFLI